MATGTRKPRVLIFAGHFAEIALRFGSALSAHADVRVLAEAGNLQAEWGDVSLPSNLRIIPFHGKSIRRMGPALLSQLLLFRPDIVQFEETTSRWLAPLIRLARIFARIVLRVHDVKTHSGRDAELPERVLRGREWGRTNADLVLVHGPFCREAFVANYATPVHETVHGVILTPVAAHIRRPEPGRLLMFGRLEVYKGLEVLTRAMELLAERGLKADLTIAGRGPELIRLRPRLEALGTVEIIETFLPAQEVPGLFQRAALIVLPYIDATQSGVAAGAIANHRAVIASRTGGLPDMVVEGESGILVPPGDPAALADAIAAVLAAPQDLARMEAGAAALAANLLNWDRIVEELMPALIALARGERALP